MSDQENLFEHAASFVAAEPAGAVQLGRLEAHYEELFAEALEDGIITPEERARLDRTADALGLDRARLAQLERALRAAYEARHRVRVRDLSAPLPDIPGPPPAPAGSLAPLEPSNDPRVIALERRVRELEARVAELLRELAEARAQIAFGVDLSHAQPSVEASEADDPEALHKRLRRDARDLEALRALYRAFGRAGDVDRQWCTAHALAYLGAAGDEERALYERGRGDALIRPRAALERESFRRLLYHPEEEPLIGEIFAVVVAPVLLGRLAALRRDKALVQLDPSLRQDPASSTVQAVRCFAWAAAILGQTSPPLYTDPSYPGSVELVPATAPSLRLGKQALSGRAPAELAFLAGYKLAYFRDDHFIRWLLPSIPDLEDIFLASLSIGNPGLPLSGQVKARVTPIAEAIAPILEPAQIDRLRGHFLRFVEDGGRANLQRWVSAVDGTAARAGLLLSNDLGASHSMLALEDPVTAEAKMDDLIVFVCGERYAKLRRQLGIAVEA